MEDTQNIEALNPRQLLDYKISRAKDDFKLEYAKGGNDWWQCFATRVTGINTAFYKAQKSGLLSPGEVNLGKENMKKLINDLNEKHGYPQEPGKNPVKHSLSETKREDILNSKYTVKSTPAPSEQEQDEWFARLDILAEPEEKEMPKAA